MLTQIMLYEEMNRLSSRMASAARAKDWETLHRLAGSVAALRNSLPDNDKTLSETELQQKIILIQRILKDDAEIRRQTAPWMEHAYRFLGYEQKNTLAAQKRSQAR